jgi:hypothetical protein
MRSRSTSYDHVQRAPLYLLILLPGLVVALVAIFVSEPVLRWVLAASGALSIVLSACFRQLRVRDAGDRLALTFGPLELFKKRLPYAQMRAARAARSDMLDGWGIHWVAGRGWIYNLWGYDCVAIELANGKRVRVGTDDPRGLVSFLESRIGGRS